MIMRRKLKICEEWNAYHGEVGDYLGVGWLVWALEITGLAGVVLCVA